MLNVIALLGLGVLFIAIRWIVQSINHYKQAKAWNCKPPSRAPGFLGIASGLRHLKANNEKRWLELLEHEYSLFGKTHEQTILGQDIITTTDPDNIKAMLSTQFKDFILGKRLQQFFPLAGASVFTLDGPGWSHARALLRPQFTRDQITDLSMVDEHVTNLVNLFPKDGSAFDLQPLFYMFTLDASTHFLLGESINCMLPSSEKTGILAKCAVKNAKGFADVFDRGLAYLTIRARAHSLYWLINPKEFRDLTKKFREVFEYYVNSALESKKNSESTDDRYTFIRALVEESDDPVMIRDNLQSIMAAGRDTTASLLSSTFFYLARHQSVYRRLRRDITEMFGDMDCPKLEITHARLKELSYLQYVLNEC